MGHASRAVHKMALRLRIQSLLEFTGVNKSGPKAVSNWLLTIQAAAMQCS